MEEGRRKRGDQPGNRKSLKHGFYSTTLTPEVIGNVWQLLNRGIIGRKMAFRRI